jgi:exodeoxyribonuclease VII small subunit
LSFPGAAFRPRYVQREKEIHMPKPSSKKTEKAVEELTYEEALAQLEEIVSALEGEQNQLEESIKLFERGQALAARCGVLLEAAELKVKQVVGDEVIPFEEPSE